MNKCNIKHYQAGKGDRPVKYNKEKYDSNFSKIKWKSKKTKSQTDLQVLDQYPKPPCSTP